MNQNMASRKNFDFLNEERRRYISRLLPIKEKLRKTDWLIDQIGYKLYGLIEEEIKLVEGVL